MLKLWYYGQPRQQEALRAAESWKDDRSPVAMRRGSYTAAARIERGAFVKVDRYEHRQNKQKCVRIS